MHSSHNKEKSAHKFNSSAKSYTHAAHLQQLTAQVLCDSLTVDNKIILDIGSGPQVCEKFIKQFNSTYINLDIAKNMLHAPLAVCADMDFLPFKNNSIDVIIANLSMHWSTDIAALLQRCTQLLKKDGALKASICVEGTLKELKQSFAMLDNYVHAHDFPTPQALQHTLKTLTHTSYQCELKTHVFSVNSLLEFFRDLKKLGVTNTHPQQKPTLMTPRTLRTLEHYYRSLHHNHLPVSYEVAYVTLSCKTA